MRIEAILGFQVALSATAFDGKQSRSLEGVTRSLAVAQPRVGSKLFTHAHCLLDLRKMCAAERQQIPPCTADAWGGVFVVGTIARFLRVESSVAGARIKHAVVKVFLYRPPIPPLPARDPLNNLLVVDRSRKTTCFFCPRALGPVVALGAGVPGFRGLPDDAPRYWSVLRVDNP
jgi:hypothetical protein